MFPAVTKSSGTLCTDLCCADQRMVEIILLW